MSRYHPTRVTIQADGKAYLPCDKHASFLRKEAEGLSDHELGDADGAVLVEHTGDYSSVAICAWSDGPTEWVRVAHVNMGPDELEALGKACLLAADMARMTATYAARERAERTDAAVGAR